MFPLDLEYVQCLLCSPVYNMFPLDFEYVQCLLSSPVDIYVSFGLRVYSVLTVFTHIYIYVSFGLRVCSVLTVFTHIYVSFGLQSMFSAYCVHLYVQCLLCSPVPPSLCPAEEEWSDEACLAFEELTHCAKWKVLSACTVGYDDDLPCIQLVDNAPDQVSL